MRYKKGQSGNPGGRPKGAKDVVPRGTLRAAVALVAQQHPELIYKALKKGIEGRVADKYLRIVADVEGDDPTMPNHERTVVILKRRGDDAHT